MPKVRSRCNTGTPHAAIGALGPRAFRHDRLVSLACRLVTPPYGLTLSIACSVAGTRMKDALWDTNLMLLPMLVVLALLVMWPQIALFLPSLISPEFQR
jgi:hypothetical protein